MKKEIVSRLLKDGHINFDEALELMETEKVFMQPEPIQFKEFHPYEVQRQWDRTPSPYWWLNPPVTCQSYEFAMPDGMAVTYTN